MQDGRPGPRRHDVIELHTADFDVTEEAMNSIRIEVNRQLSIISHRHSCRASHTRASLSAEVSRLNAELVHSNAEIARLRQEVETIARRVDGSFAIHGTCDTYDLQTIHRAQTLLYEAWTLLDSTHQRVPINSAIGDSYSREDHTETNGDRGSYHEIDVDLGLDIEDSITVDFEHDGRLHM